MILWRSNLTLDESVLSEVITHTKEVCPYADNTYTSYFIPNVHDRPEVKFVQQYYDLLEIVCSDMGLIHRTSYNFTHWIQVYDRGGIHDVHDHFVPDTLFSWVHFVRPTNVKCFHFIDSEGNKTYPTQEPGDFIVFPSWAQHAVDPNETDDQRVVIAGNVNVVEMIKPSNVNPLKLIVTPLPNDVTVSQITKL